MCVSWPTIFSITMAGCAGIWRSHDYTLVLASAILILYKHMVHKIISRIPSPLHITIIKLMPPPLFYIHFHSLETLISKIHDKNIHFIFWGVGLIMCGITGEEELWIAHLLMVRQGFSSAHGLLNVGKHKQLIKIMDRNIRGRCQLNWNPAFD